MEKKDPVRNCGYHVREVLKAGCGGGDKKVATGAFDIMLGKVRPKAMELCLRRER